MAAVERIVNRTAERYPGRELTIENVACQVFDPDGTTEAGPTRAQIESVRRACKRLAALGRVELRASHESRNRRAMGIPGFKLLTMQRTYLLVRARRTTDEVER